MYSFRQRTLDLFILWQRVKQILRPDAQINDFSKMRANSVAEYFISKGIDPKRIVVIGRGDSNPLDADNLASEVNRRTEFYFKPKLGY